MVYSPLALVGTVELTPVWELVRTTLAAGMTAPDASRTVPVMVPRSDWAKAPKARQSGKTRRTRRKKSDIELPFL